VEQNSSCVKLLGGTLMGSDPGTKTISGIVVKPREG